MGKPGGKKKKPSAGKHEETGEKQQKSRELHPVVDEDMEVFIMRAQELKEEGNKLFQKRDYLGAMSKYEQALKLLPKNHIDFAYLHSNIAACYMQLTPPEYVKAVAECNLALSVSSKYTKALLKRSRCFEALNKLEKALKDVNTVLNIEPNNMTALEIHERVTKSIEERGLKVNDKKVVSEGTNSLPVVENGQANDSTAKEKPRRKKNNKSEDKTNTSEDKTNTAEDKTVVEEKKKEVLHRATKLVLGEDIRLAQLPTGCSLSQMRDIVQSRFPSLKAVLVKYRDQEGDLITITTTEELRWAEEFVHSQGSLRFYVYEVSPEQEPTFEHLKSGSENDEKRVPAQNSSSENGSVKYHGDSQPHPDHWMMDFARMFKNHVGIDSDEYLDLHELGMRLYTEAVEDVVTCEEAQDLFDIAANKFQEMAALAMLNWGNVHMSRARKRPHLDENACEDLLLSQMKNAYEWAMEEYVKAGEKYTESLKLKPDFYEGYLALGQQHFEQAKLSWYFALGSKVDLAEWPSEEVLHMFNCAEDNMEHGTQIWEEMEERRLKELKPVFKPRTEKIYLHKFGLHGLVKELSTDEAADQASKMRSQINLLWGKMLYDRSIIEFKLDIETWEECLFASLERFKLAGASPTDIAVMIKNHCSNATAQEGLAFKIDEIVQAWNEIYDAKRWMEGVPSFRLEPLFRRSVSNLHHFLEHA